MSDLSKPLHASWSLSFALLGDTFLYAFLPLHAAEVHVPGLWVGVLLSINRFVRLGLTPWMAALFHRFGFRRLTMAAAGLAIASTAGYGAGWGVAGWLLLRLGWGASFAVLRLSSLRYALDGRRPCLSLGVSRSILELGPIAALVAGPWLLARTGAAGAFAGLALGSVPALWFAARVPERQDDPRKTAPVGGLRLAAPSLVNGLTFLSAFAVEGLVAVAVGVLLRRAYPAATVTTVTAWVAGYLLLRRLGSVVLAPAGGWLADRYGLEKVYAASLGLVGVGLLLLASGQVPAGLLVLVVFNGVNAALAVGGALAGQVPTTQGVAENVAWRDAGAAIGVLVGGLLLASDWLALVLLSSSVALLGLLARYARVFIPLFKLVIMEIEALAPSEASGRAGAVADPVAQLYEEFHGSLLRYIRGKIKRKEDGEDILHDVFVRIAAKEDALSQKENLKNWLFILTRNAIIDHYRKQGVRKSVALGELLAESLAEEGAEAEQATGGLDQCLARFIDQLPETYKPILIDSELKGLKQKELAQKYQMPYSSLRSRVQRGREKVRQQLLDCCRIETDRWGNVLEAVPHNACAADRCKKC